ncbi:MAG: hypothetical protein NC548_31460 [Lachnospiraceae bacterium]|nr:hypothetical protein [Lachnospiraceae bacterium]
MTDTFVSSTMDKSRREVLINVTELLDNKSRLRGIVGTNALVDCALLVVAESDEVWMQNLQSVLDTQQLREDIAHVRNSALLRKKRKEMLR